MGFYAPAEIVREYRERDQRFALYRLERPRGERINSGVAGAWRRSAAPWS